jgi:uncharacterized protein (TIGR02271 family)
MATEQEVKISNSNEAENLPRLHIPANEDAVRIYDPAATAEVYSTSSGLENTTHETFDTNLNNQTPFVANTTIETNVPDTYQNENRSYETINENAGASIPVIEEQVKIEKRIVETAKVNISKVVHGEVKHFTVPFSEENISVERIPKNEYVDTLPPAIRYEGDVMIIPVLKEVAVVEKRVMLVEELRVTKQKVEKSETHEVTLRKEEVEVNRTELNKQL